MKMTEIHIERMVRRIFSALKEKQLIQFKQAEDAVFKHAVALVNKEFDKERELDREVNAMLDDLERKNPGEFERYKMYPLLKKRLAKEKGIVL